MSNSDAFTLKTMQRENLYASTGFRFCEDTDQPNTSTFYLTGDTLIPKITMGLMSDIQNPHATERLRKGNTNTWGILRIEDVQIPWLDLLFCD